MAAVVQGAAAGGAAGVEAGHHHGFDVGQMGCRARDVRWRLGGDAAVQRRVHLVGPLLAGLDQLHDGDAVQVDLLEHFQLGPAAQVPVAKLAELAPGDAVGGLAAWVQQVRVGRTLVVDAEHGPTSVPVGVFAGTVHVIKVHAVVLVTNALGPVVGLGALVAIAWHPGTDRVAAGVQHCEAVARWQYHLVGQAFVQRCKAQSTGFAGAAGGVCMGKSRQHGGGREGCEPEAATDQAAACRIGQGFVQHLLKVFVIRGVAVVVVECNSHGDRSLWGEMI